MTDTLPDVEVVGQRRRSNGTFPAGPGGGGGGGGDPSAFRIYIVGTRADPGEQARLQIRVYDETNLDGDEDNPGPEVNPDAQPCPV